MAPNEPLILVRPETRPTFVPLERRDPKLGEILVEAGYIDAATLRRALERRNALDTRLGTILHQAGLVDAEILTDALALQWNLNTVDLTSHPPHASLLRDADFDACLRLGCLPWRRVDGMTILAVADPACSQEARRACGLDGRSTAIALAPRPAIRAALTEARRAALEEVARTRCPAHLSCRRLAAPQSRLVLPGLAIGAVALAFAFPKIALWCALFWMLTFNLGAAALRLSALIARLTAPTTTQHSVTRLSDHRRKPRISLLIPLHQEDRVVPSLIVHLRRLDYPPELLDVKLLIEEHDTVTRNAIEATGFAVGFDVVTVPDHTLKTKPRALNYGLRLCDGDIVGVLDAEDRPDPQQLNAVVTHLWNAPPHVAAVQGQLDFYNARRNWMSRLFTIEYAIWFNVLMRGFRLLDLPIPLGGTSVYFRRNRLEEAGAWDAHNVTEDADLGMRLARAGLTTEMLPSTTLEEANARFWPWIKQRSRWLKGYMLTWYVHMRRPATLYRDLGARGFLAFQLVFLGGITSYLSAPAFLALWVGGASGHITAVLGGSPTLWLAATASMLFGQAVVLAVAVTACMPPDKRHLLPWIITAPVYWQIGAVATLKALAELVYAPFFWDKTRHGHLSDQDTENDALPKTPIDSVYSPGASIGSRGM